MGDTWSRFAVRGVNLGNDYRSSQRWDEARCSLEKALELDDSSAEAHYNLGVLYLEATEIGGMDRAGRLEASMTYFNAYRSLRSEEINPGDPVHDLLREARGAFHPTPE